MRYSEQFMEHIEYAFAAFCRVVLRNAAISAYRDFGRKQKREVSLDYLMSETPFEPFTTDNYFEQYDKPTVFVAKGQEIIITSERLADALLKSAGAAAYCPADVFLPRLHRYRSRERVRTEQKHSELLETRGIEAVEKGMVKIRA